MRLLLAACAFAAAAPIAAPAPACAEEGARASVHIVFEDGRTVSRCVGLGGGQTGIDALRATGIPLVTEEFAGAGSLVCAVDGEGRAFPTESCVPPCPSGSCRFWAYFTRERATGRWAFSDTGASSRVLRDGDADAWVFGEHRIDGSSFTGAVDETVCARGVSAPLTPAAAARVPLAAVAPLGLVVLFGAGAVRRNRSRRRAA